eukprot:Partr_v1_DN22402_c0_g1_i1_m32072 putative ADP-ribosylation factor-like
MGIALTKLVKLFWRSEEIKIVLVGLDNAGKTTIVYRLYAHSTQLLEELINACVFGIYRLMNEVVATTPTIGSNVEEIVYKNIHFLMWDIGGQQSLRSSWSTYYVNTRVRKIPVV